RTWCLICVTLLVRGGTEPSRPETRHRERAGRTSVLTAQGDTAGAGHLLGRTQSNKVPSNSSTATRWGDRLGGRGEARCARGAGTLAGNLVLVTVSTRTAPNPCAVYLPSPASSTSSRMVL